MNVVLYRIYPAESTFIGFANRSSYEQLDAGPAWCRWLRWPQRRRGAVHLLCPGPARCPEEPRPRHDASLVDDGQSSAGQLDHSIAVKSALTSMPAGS